MEAVILAAGSQTRFDLDGRGCPKCLRQVGEDTILSRLVSKLGEIPATIVINNLWASKYRAIVGPMGNVVVIEANRNIGHSMAEGIRNLATAAATAVFYNADNFIPTEQSLLIPEGIGTIIDPWEWITIYRLPATRSWADHLEATCYDRVDFLQRDELPMWIRRTGWININREEDLQRACDLG